MHKPLIGNSLSRVSLAALTAAAVFNFQSCSNDDPLPEVNERRLVGRWKLDGGTITNDLDSNEVAYFEFEKSGTFRLFTEYDYGNSGYGELYRGAWEWANAEKDSLHAIVDEDTLFFHVDKLDAKELNLTQHYYGYIQTWEFQSAD